MLTIGKIDLNIKPQIGLKTAKLHEDLKANYDIINTWFAPDELLHLLSGGASEPTQIDMTTLVSGGEYHYNSDVKLEIINNVVNRILSKEENDFSYTDRVFIENTLQKIGINDTQNFMNLTRQMKTEQSNITALTKLYRENKQMLKEHMIMHSEQNEFNDRSKTENITENQNRYFMHNDVLERLQTSEIISDVYKLHDNVTRSDSVFSRQFNMTEQLKLSNFVEYKNLSTEINMHSSPAEIHHGNIYEMPAEDGEGESQNLSLEKSTAAVMLNLLSSTATALNHIENKYGRTQIDITEAIGTSAINTLLRLKTAYESREKTEVIRQSMSTEEVTKLLTREREIASNIISGTVNNYVDNSSFGTKTDNFQNIQVTHPVTENEQTEEEISSSDSPTTVENNTERMVRELEIMREKNRLAIEKMQSIQSTTTEKEKLTVDREKVFRDSLELLNNEKSIEEILENAPTTNVDNSSQIFNQIYEMADDATKSILDAVAKYESDPTAVSNIIKPAGMDRLVTQINDNQQPIAESEMTHKSAEFSGDFGDDNALNGGKTEIDTVLESIKNYEKRLIQEQNSSFKPENVQNSEMDFTSTKTGKDENETPTEKIIRETLRNTQSEILLSDMPETNITPANIQNISNEVNITENENSDITNSILQAINRFDQSNNDVKNIIRSVEHSHEITQIQNIYSRPETEIVYGKTEETAEETIASPPKTERKTDDLFEKVSSNFEKSNVDFSKLPLEAAGNSEVIRGVKQAEKAEIVYPENTDISMQEQELISESVTKIVREIEDKTIRHDSNFQSVERRISEQENLIFSKTHSNETQTVHSAELFHKAEENVVSEILNNTIKKTEMTKSYTIDNNVAIWEKSPVTIRHKQQEQSVSEDYVEELIRGVENKTVNSVTEKIIDNRISNIKEMNNISQITTTNSEDIAEIVNKTISKQMGTITDKVYSQMEKRLQKERARRGR